MKKKQAQKLSQLQLVNNYIKQIEAHFEAIEGDQLDYRGLYELMGHLVKTLNKALNRPPIDEGDGSISGRQFLAGMRVARAVRELQAACEEWKRLV